MKDKKDDCYSSEEAAKRRDEVIRNMANTPPQPRAKNLPHRRKEKKADEDRAAPKDRAGRT